ncbi:MAG: hypothetical protein ACQESR_19710 [Planctomycetota bacterium]
MERCPTQAVLPLVGLAADEVIRDRYNRRSDLSGWNAARRKPSSRWSDSRRTKSSATGICSFAARIPVARSRRHVARQ